MADDAEAIQRHLLQLKELRGARRAQPPRLKELKRWQSARLEDTYADLAAEPRYREATSFFLEDLLGRKVDLITTESLSPYIGPHILREVEYAPLST